MEDAFVRREQHNFVRRAAAGAALMALCLLIGAAWVYFDSDLVDERNLAIADCMMNQGYGAWRAERFNTSTQTLDEFCTAVGSNQEPVSAF